MELCGIVAFLSMYIVQIHIKKLPLRVSKHDSVTLYIDMSKLGVHSPAVIYIIHLPQTWSWLNEAFAIFATYCRVIIKF